MARNKKKLDIGNPTSIIDVLVAGISPAFYPRVPYVEEAHKNPRYLFKKVRYSRKKRKELLSRHQEDLKMGKYGVKPWDPTAFIAEYEAIKGTTKKLTFHGSLTTKDLIR